MNPFTDYMHGYDLCNDTVTVYHEEGGEVTKTVYTNAYFEKKKTENVERTGSEQANGFLLVIPVGHACTVNDKVILGEGPDVPANAMEWWRTFIPARVDGLVIVKTVETQRFGGADTHTEAGG